MTQVEHALEDSKKNLENVSRQQAETEQHQRDDTVQHGFAANIELHLL